MYRVNKVENLANNFFKLAGVKLIKKAAELDADASTLLHYLKKEINSLRKTSGAEDLVRELKLFKAKYQEAILINGGYQVISNNIKNIMNEYSDLIFDENEEEDETPLENLLNQFSSDIRRRSKDVPPSPQKDRLVLDAGREAEFRLDEGESERSLDPAVYEGGGNEPLSEEVETEEYGSDRVSNPSEDDIGSGSNVFAKLVGGDGEKGAPTGYQTEGYKYTNWIGRYNDIGQEIVNETKELNTPEAYDIGYELAKMYFNLANEASKWIANFEEYKDTINPEERKLVEQKQIKVEEDMNALREQIRGQKQKFTSLKRAKYIQSLKDDLFNTKDPTERFIKEQQIAIAETANSRLKMYGPLQELRRDMIKKLKGKVHKDRRTGEENVYGKIALTPEVIKDFNEKIEEAKKSVISLDEWRKQHAEKIRKQLGVVEQTERGKANIRNVSLMKLDGHIKAIGLSLLSERSTLKDRVVKDISKALNKEDSKELKDMIGAVAKAANAVNKSVTQKQNNPGNPKLEQKHRENEKQLYNTVHMFREYIKRLMETEVKQKLISIKPKISQLMISIRSSKFLYNYRNQLQNLSSLEDKSSLSPEDVDNIRSVIDEGKKLAEFYRNLKIPQIGEPEGRGQLWKDVGTEESPEYKLDVEKYLPEGKEKPYETPANDIMNSVEYLENLLASKPKEEKIIASIQERLFLLSKLSGGKQ